MVRNAGPQEWMFLECQQLNNIAFRFKDKERPILYVDALVKNLDRYPLEEVLEGPFIMSEFRKDLIEQVADLLVPSNVWYEISIFNRNFYL